MDEKHPLTVIESDGWPEERDRIGEIQASVARMEETIQRIERVLDLAEKNPIIKRWLGL